MPSPPPGASAVWLVLDLTAEADPARAASLRAALREHVAGLTLVAAPPLREALASAATEPATIPEALVEPAAPARLLAAQAARLPAGVTALGWAAGTLEPGVLRRGLAAALAQLDAESPQRCAAVAAARPVTDALREVDARGDLVGCVEREGLFALEPLLLMRREQAVALAGADAASAERRSHQAPAEHSPHRFPAAGAPGDQAVAALAEALCAAGQPLRLADLGAAHDDPAGAAASVADGGAR